MLSAIIPTNSYKHNARIYCEKYRDIAKAMGVDVMCMSKMNIVKL